MKRDGRFYVDLRNIHLSCAHYGFMTLPSILAAKY